MAFGAVDTDPDRLMHPDQENMMDILLWGEQAPILEPELRRYSALEVVTDHPEVVVSFGGDGTLLAAELAWPGVPKVPIRNSRRGVRCLPHPPADILRRLAGCELVENTFTKLECTLYSEDSPEPICFLTAMNEFNIHMGHINQAVRFKLWINEAPYLDGLEILGDGFVFSTPFGSTAYYNQITHGIFHAGFGLAFKYTKEHTNHMVMSEDAVVRVRITRGPAVLAFDNSPEYFTLNEGDELVMRKHPEAARILTCEPIAHPCDIF